MKPILKIDFTDFWSGFNKEDNFFYNLLSTKFNVQISTSPDILFYSVYSTNHLKYRCLRVLYSGENERPDFNGCDYALTFDYLENDKHYRLPLYALYIEQRNWIEKLLSPTARAANSASWERKEKFCCMLVSNANAKKRIHFFKKLNRIKRVDSGGKVLNNIGGPVSDKMEFISAYKFVFAFENSCYPGYTTEKILEPIIAGCIPIYWGNPRVAEEFNPARFINYDDFESEEKLIEHLIELDNNDDAARNIISQPVFKNNVLPRSIEDKNVLAFLESVVNSIGKQKPVAQTSKKFVYALSVEWKKTWLIPYYCRLLLRRIGLGKKLPLDILAWCIYLLTV